MKIKILIIILSFISIPILGQENNQINEIINKSLLSIIEDKKMFESKGILTPYYIENLYILTDDLPLNFMFSNSMKNTNLKTSLLGDIPKKKLKKGIFAISFNYIALNNNRISVYFVNKRIKVKKNNLNISLGDGYIFTYEYSCNEHKWVFVERIPKLSNPSE